jgi:hypothetical protein
MMDLPSAPRMGPIRKGGKHASTETQNAASDVHAMAGPAAHNQEQVAIGGAHCSPFALYPVQPAGGAIGDVPCIGVSR